MTSGHLAGRRTGFQDLSRGAMIAYQTKAKGPEAKELTIGRVLVNEKDRRMFSVQPYEAVWAGCKVVHRPQFQTPYGYTTVPNHIEAKESIRYEAVVSQVETLSGGELKHGCARSLSDRGWGLLLNRNESVRFQRTFVSDFSLVLEKVLSIPTRKKILGSGGVKFGRSVGNLELILLLLVWEGLL